MVSNSSIQRYKIIIALFHDLLVLFQTIVHPN